MTAGWLLAAASLFPAVSLAQGSGAPAVVVGDPEGAPGGRTTLTVGLETGTAEVGGWEHMVRFDPRAARLGLRDGLPDCSPAPATGKRLDVRPLPDLGGFRAAVLAGASRGAIPSGPVYFCTLEIPLDAVDGEYPIDNGELVAYAPDGAVVAGVAAVSGTLTVRAGDPVVLRAGEALGVPGGLAELAVFLESRGVAVNATRNTIGLAAPGVRFHRTGGRPDCRANPLTGKVLDAFLLEDSVLVAELVPLLGGASLPDGELYRCTLVIDEEAPVGVYPVTLGEVAASDIEGRPVRPVEGAPGTVVVARSRCAGDCDLDGQVEIADLLRAIGVALGQRGLRECLLADVNRDGRVRVAELVQAVRHGLEGCP